jgi:hypothetical protein
MPATHSKRQLFARFDPMDWRPLGRGLWGRSRVRMATILFARVSTSEQLSTSVSRPRRLASGLDQVVWDEGVSASAQISLSDPRAAACSTCCAMATP